MPHESPRDDLRAIFANPWVWLATHCVFPLLTLASTAYCAWLLWEELDANARGVSIAAIAIPAAVMVASLAAVFVFRKREFPLWLSIASAVVGVAYLIGRVVLSASLIPPNPPDWMVS